MRIIIHCVLISCILGGCSKYENKTLLDEGFTNELAEFEHSFSSKGNLSHKVLKVVEIIKREDDELKRKKMACLLKDALLVCNFYELNCDLRVIRASDFYFSVLAVGEGMKSAEMDMDELLEFYVSGWIKYKELCHYRGELNTSKEKRCQKECKAYYKSASKRYSYLVTEVFCKKASEDQKKAFVKQFEKICGVH